MKSIFKILFVLGSLALFISCASAKKATIEKENEKQARIEMKVAPERNGGTPETLDLTIKNNTGEVIQFGANYSIQRRSDNEWIDVDLDNFAVIAIMYSLQPGESGEYKVNLFPKNVNYTEGEYRIVKQIAIGEKGMHPYYSNFQVMEPRK